MDDTSEGWEVAVAVMHQFRLAVPGECCCNDPELVGGLREVFSFEGLFMGAPLWGSQARSAPHTESPRSPLLTAQHAP